MNSFRLRLALLVAGATTVLLLGGGWLAWTLAEDTTVARLDRDLRHLAGSNLERVEDASHWARLDTALGFLSGGDRPPAFVLWVANYDREVYRSPRWPAALDPRAFPAPAAYAGGVTVTTPPPPPKRAGLSARNPPLPVKETLLVDHRPAGHRWRVAVSGNPYTHLVLAANLDELNLDQQRLRDRLLLLLPLVLLVAGAAAWWLAARALRPVVALTRAAEGLTALGLDRRIAAPAHDREFRRLVDVFNAMLDRLERSFHQARRFSADASHELKTPLALLQAELEQSLHHAPPGSPWQQSCTSLLEEVHRLKAILEKLLLLSLADSGRLALQLQPVPLAPLLAAVLEDAAALAPDLGLDSVVAPDVTVRADAVLLEQALQNLLANAVKYNRPAGHIRVVVRTEAAGLVITVGNTGPGIPPADQPRLFERFYRGDRARSPGSAGGVGLGLSLAREILRAHGGDLTLARADPDWTEFQATLPAPA